MTDILGNQKSIDAYKSILGTIQLIGAVVDILASTRSEILSGKVCIDGLCMHKTEVTESSYASVMGKFPSSNGPNMPVMDVRFKNAKAYCEKVHMRLPTRAEWEKFAGPREFATHDGKLVNDKGEKEANFDSKGPMNVGSFPPNSHGMYDMTGNAWEIARDEGEVMYVQGGSWDSSIKDFLRVIPYIGDPFINGKLVGFRCVSSQDSK